MKSTTKLKQQSITAVDGQMTQGYTATDPTSAAVRRTIADPRSIILETSGTHNPDFYLGNHFDITLNGNISLELPKNIEVGQTGRIILRNPDGHLVNLSNEYYMISENPDTWEQALMLFEYTVISLGMIQITYIPHLVPFIFTMRTSSVNESISLPLVSGSSYSFNVNWGDGSTGTVNSSSSSEAIHTYTQAGDHQILISGLCERFFFEGHKDRNKLISIENLGKNGWKSFHSAFQDCKNLESFVSGDCDTSRVTSFYEMFYNCSAIKTIDASSMDTSGVTSMFRTFRGCANMTTCDISGWDTSKVTTMSEMFYEAKNITTIDVSGWNTSKVTNMYGAFLNCYDLTTLNVSGWDTSNVTSMSNTFKGCGSLLALDVSGFNTSKATSMSAMFSGCNDLTTLDVSGFDTSKVTSMSSMFQSCTYVTEIDVSGFNTSKVTSMSSMFSGSASVTTLDVTGFDTSSCTSFYNMFNGCYDLVTIDISGFNTAKVTSIYGIFYNCRSLTSALNMSTRGDLWNVSKVTNMARMFTGNTSGNHPQLLTVVDISGWVTSSLTTCYDTFSGLKNVAILDVFGWDVSNLIPAGSPSQSLNSVFNGCAALVDLGSTGVANWRPSSADKLNHLFNGCSSLTSAALNPADPGNLSSWGLDVGLIKSMTYMFNGCSSLTTLDLSEWKTSKATDKGTWNASTNTPALIDGTGDYGDYYKITNGATVDLGSGPNLWNTNYYITYDNSKWVEYAYAPPTDLTDMTYTFSSCSNLTDLNLEGFNTSEVTSLSATFYGCNSLTTLNIGEGTGSGWDTSKVTSMSSAFRTLSSITTIGFSTNWNTSAVTNFSHTFESNTSMTCLPSIDTTAATDKTNMFGSCSALVNPNPAAQSDIADTDGANWVNTEACATYPGIANTPGPISDFVAIDATGGDITITWTHAIVGTPAATYDLYETAGTTTTLIASGVTSGTTHNVGAGLDKDFYITATNTPGKIYSNIKWNLDVT